MFVTMTYYIYLLSKVNEVPGPPYSSNYELLKIKAYPEWKDFF